MRKTITSLEGLRGAAALLVVIYHSSLGISWMAWARNGYLAVDLFFVLSGYVICTAYEQRLDDPTEFRVFMIRRFGRLWPVHMVTTGLYYVSLNLGVIAAVFAGYAHGPAVLPNVGESAALVSMSHGLFPFDHFVGSYANWSVSDEFYVYILFGVLCLALRGRARVVVYAALAIVGYALAVTTTVHVRKCVPTADCFNMTLGFGWTRCQFGFFAGTLIAHFRDARIFHVLRKPPAQVCVLAVAVAFFACAHRPPLLALAAPFVFVPLVVSLTDNRGPVAALFDAQPFQYLGRVSYSVYLGHVIFRPIFAIVQPTTSWQVQAGAITLFIFSSFALAHFLYTRVEAPYRARIYAWSDHFRANAPRVAID
ncbi:acyltransferase [Trinickia sp. YCB016]